MSSTPPRYLAGFDGLRGLACLAVFGVHLQQLTGVGASLGPIDLARLLQNGNTGVCLLFMLSGFLLALPIWSDRPEKDAAAPTPGLLAFAIKRIGRIVPAYFLCLTALVLLGRGKGANDAVLHYLFLHNFHEATIYGINEPFWTLAVQAQFYVVFAGLMLVLRPLRNSGAATVLLLLGAIGGTYAAHHALLTWAAQTKAWPLPPQVVTPDGPVLRLSLLAHLPHFLLGVLTARIFHATRKTASREMQSTAEYEAAARNRALGFDGLFTVAAVAILAILAVPAWDDLLRIPPHTKDDAMIGRYNLPYVPLLLAIMIFSAPRGRLIKEVLEFAPLRLLGVISFGVYVYHLPCLELIKRWMVGAGADPAGRWHVLAGGGLLLSVVVAAASYVLIEQPILKWARERRTPRPAQTVAGQRANRRAGPRRAE